MVTVLVILALGFGPQWATDIRTQLLEGDPVGGGPGTLVPGGDVLVSCGCAGGSCGADGGLGSGKRAQVAGVRIAQGPLSVETERGGGSELGLREPNPIFAFVRRCLPNAILQRLWMIRALELTGGTQLDLAGIRRVAEQIVDASAVKRPPAGSIRIPEASLSAVVEAVQSWPPAGEADLPSHTAPDARKIRTDADLELARRMLADNIRDWGGAAVYLADATHGFTIDGRRVPEGESHVFVIYSGDAGFAVVDNGHVSPLLIVREDKFCWDQLSKVRGVPRIFQLCVQVLPDHVSKKKVPPTPTIVPPGG